MFNLILQIACIISIILQILSLNVEYYCEFGCNQPNTTHGVCINKEKNLIDNCPKNAKVIPLNDYQDAILEVHNDKRQFVASGKERHLPPASQMGELSWDEILAELAEYSARRCLIKDPYCYKTAEGLEPGRSANIFKTATDEIFDYKEIIPARINDWLETSVSATKEMVLKFPEDPPEHVDFFGRGIIDMNNKVGCAAAEWLAKNMKYLLLVCLYRINVVPGNRLYKVGAPASRCSALLSENYIGLCGVMETYASDVNRAKNIIRRRRIPRTKRYRTTERSFKAPEGDLWSLVMK